MLASGRSPHACIASNDIHRYPLISIEIKTLRYPDIPNIQIPLGYLVRIYSTSFWIWKDIFFGYERMSVWIWKDILGFELLEFAPKDIHRNPEKSREIQTFRYLLDIFTDKKGCLLNIFLDMKGYLFGYERISWNKSIDIQFLSIHLYWSFTAGIQYYISNDIH
jgi:hypothetical protein